MAGLRDIKKRIKSVKNTHQITKAMKMVSAAKLRRAQEDILAARPYADKIQAARPYADKIQGLISSLSANIPVETHPFFATPETNNVVLILITSDRGLCGSFNANLLRTAEGFIEERPDSEISLDLIGRRGVEYFKRRPVKVAGSRPMGSKRPDYGFASTIAREVIASHTKERYRRGLSTVQCFPVRPVPEAGNPEAPARAAPREKAEGGGKGRLYFRALRGGGHRNAPSKVR
jgi:F-type H+-transporting ATPase subunit gamma